MKQKNKILFILKLSKYKHTGFYTMNSYVFDSLELKNKYCCSHIKMYSAGYPIKFLNSFFNFLKIFWYSLEIIVKLIIHNPQIIYFTISPKTAFLRDTIYVFIIKLFKKKIVYHLHGKGIREKASNNSLYRILYKWAYRNTYVICLSEKVQYDIDWLPIKGIHIVPNAIDINQKFINRVVQSSNPSLKVLYFSNLIKTKGIFDFINAVLMLFEKHYEFDVLIAGQEYDVSYEEIRSITYLHKKHFKLLGPLYGNRKLNIFHEADILIFPTLLDTYPLILIEALAFGLTVITTNEGATTDIIKDGENGYIVKKNDPAHIAGKLVLLIDNPNFLKQYSMNNIKRYNDYYTFDNFQNKLSLVLKYILND